jgi:RHS repeat-associated protein
LAALKTGTGATYFYHYNHTGSTVALSSTTGAVVNAYDYEDFGKVTSKMEAVLNPFTFVGAHGVMDEGDGLFFMKNRYYHASLARFLQRDPAGFAGGFNLYRYVGNNPVNFIDPSGLDPWTPDSTRRAGESNYWPIQHGSGTTVHNISLGSVGDWVNTYGQNPYNPFNSLVSGIYSLSQGDVSGALYQFGIEAWDQTGGRASKFFQAFSTFMCAGSDRPADPNAPEGSGDWIINQENKRDAGIIIYEGAPSVDDGEPVIELDDEF